MNAAKALVVKTATEKTYVLSVIRDEKTREEVAAEFERAAQDWVGHLANMIGEDQAKEVVAMLERELPLAPP